MIVSIGEWIRYYILMLSMHASMLNVILCRDIIIVLIQGGRSLKMHFDSRPIIQCSPLYRQNSFIGLDVAVSRVTAFRSSPSTGFDELMVVKIWQYSR